MRQSSRVRIWAVAGTVMVGIGLACHGSAADPAPAVSGLTLQPGAVLGGMPSIGTVTLAGATTGGGATVRLASDNPAAPVPAAVVVPAGATQATFLVVTTPVAATTTASLSATAGGMTRTAPLKIYAPYLVSFSLAPQTLTGGQTSTGTITLSSAAPAGGIVFPLVASPPGVAQLPAQVTVPEGAKEVSFPVATPVVAANTSVDISTRFAGGSQLVTLAIRSDPPVVGPGTVFALPLATHDMVYDPLRRLIYASLDAPQGGTQGIAVVDPFQGVVLATVPTPMAIYGLALSDDGQYLYAITLGEFAPNAVLRMKLPSFQPNLQFDLLPGMGLFNFLSEMEVLPGHPHSLAVLTFLYWETWPGESRISIYDDDHLRPLAAILPGENYTMQFGDSAARLYTYGLRRSYPDSDSGFALQRMNVSATGISPEGITFNVITGQGTDMRYQAGRLYTTSGRAVDPEAGVLLGRFPGVLDFGDLQGNDDYYMDLVRPDVAAGRVYYLMWAPSGRRLRAYDAATCQPVGEQEIPYVYEPASRLLRWGEDGLMFRTAAKLVLLRLALRPPSDLLLVEPTAVAGGSPATGTILLPGPAPAGGTRVKLSSSDPAVVVPATLVVPPGATRGTFPITTQPVSTPTDTVIVAGADYTGIWTAHLQVRPASQP